MVFRSLIMSVMIAIVLVGCRAAEAGITMMAVSGRAVKTMVARMFLVVIVGPVVFRTVLVDGRALPLWCLLFPGRLACASER